MEEEELESWKNLIAAMKSVGMSMQEFQKTFASQADKLNKILEEAYNEDK